MSSELPEGYQPHTGGPRPVKQDVRVRVYFDCGSIEDCFTAGVWNWEWEGSPDPYCIIGYIELPAAPGLGE